MQNNSEAAAGLCRHWASNHIALQNVATQCNQHQHMLYRLTAFGHDFSLKCAGQADHRLNVAFDQKAADPQAKAVAITVVWSAVVSVIAFKIDGINAITANF